MGQPHDAVRLFGDGQVVRHHDYSEILLGVQGSQDSQDFLARSADRDCRSARRPTAPAGSATSARAMAARCISPPDSSRGLCFSRCARPTNSSSSLARAQRVAAAAQVAPRAVGDHQRREHVFQRASARAASDRTERSCRTADCAVRRGAARQSCRCARRRNAPRPRPARRACPAGATACSCPSRCGR